MYMQLVMGSNPCYHTLSCIFVTSPLLNNMPHQQPNNTRSRIQILTFTHIYHFSRTTCNIGCLRIMGSPLLNICHINKPECHKLVTSQDHIQNPYALTYLCYAIHCFSLNRMLHLCIELIQRYDLLTIDIIFPPLTLYYLPSHFKQLE